MTDDRQPEAERIPLRLRFIRRFIRFAIFFLYEDVEVYRPPGLTMRPGVPVLAVSNHFGGFADAFLLVYASPLVPRIVARDKIWKVPLAGWIMNWIGAIPVHKPEEHKGRVSNDEMFASCYEALADADRPLLIFPEGVTQEDPSIAPVKTGAARIALGARQAGTSGIRILPVGIHYEDKSALRSRVFINAGIPIDLDAEITRYAPDGNASPENRETVDRLNADIELHLRRVAPDFDDWREARALTHAADVSLRARGEAPGEVSISERDRLAAELARSREDAKESVIAAAEDYDRDLDGLGLTDEQVYERMRAGTFLGYLIRTAIVLLLAIPLALAGLPFNFWPIAGVGAMNLLPIGPAVKATLKPTGAIFFFMVSWGVALWGAFDQGVWLGLATVVLLPVSLGALIYASERLVRLLTAAKQWGRARKVEELTEQIVAKRRAVVAAVAAATPQA